MQSDVLKNIAAPSLMRGVPPRAFYRILMGAGAFIPFLQFEVAALVAVGLYIYYFRKTQKNPFFMEESAARKAHGKTVNVYPVEGNYYSA